MSVGLERHTLAQETDTPSSFALPVECEQPETPLMIEIEPRNETYSRARNLGQLSIGEPNIWSVEQVPIVRKQTPGGIE